MFLNRHHLKQQRLCGINQQRINLWWSPFIDLRVTIKSIKRLIGKKWVDRPTNRPQSKCAASGKKHTNFSHDLGVVSFRNHHFLPNWWWKKGRFYVHKFLDFAGSIDPFRNTTINGQSQKWLMECKMLSDCHNLNFEHITILSNNPFDIKDFTNQIIHS